MWPFPLYSPFSRTLWFSLYLTQKLYPPVRATRQSITLSFVDIHQPALSPICGNLPFPDDTVEDARLIHCKPLGSPAAFKAFLDTMPGEGPEALADFWLGNRSHPQASLHFISSAGPLSQVPPSSSLSLLQSNSSFRNKLLIVLTPDISNSSALND